MPMKPKCYVGCRACGCVRTAIITVPGDARWGRIVREEKRAWAARGLVIREVTADEAKRLLGIECDYCSSQKDG